MKERKRKFEDVGPVEFLALRESLGLGRYRKRAKRDPEKRKLLLDLWLKQIEEKEKNDFILVAPRRRRVNIP